jgi:hypothetical protein
MMSKGEGRGNAPWMKGASIVGPLRRGNEEGFP